MQPPRPGYFWKLPFVWEPGRPPLPPRAALAFAPIDADALVEALASIMASSRDESDLAAVDALGADGAARELIAVDDGYFQAMAEGWRLATDAAGRAVGVLLTVLFRQARSWRDGRPEGTIYYVGVLPGRRGEGHALELLHEATRNCIAADCWRIFCDTSARNDAMIAAFRRAGYVELAARERPLR